MMNKKTFIEEAKTMRRLNHPNVVRCFEVTSMTKDDGQEELYIVTELLKRSLLELLMGMSF